MYIESRDAGMRYSVLRRFETLDKERLLYFTIPAGKM